MEPVHVPSLHAYLSYRNAPAALAWMQALGFSVVRRQPPEGDSIAHSEVRLGSIVLMVASMDAAYDLPSLKGRSTGFGLYICLDDVDGIYKRAVNAGARSVFPPEDTEWGSRRARVLDPEGYEWSFGSYQPGEES